MLAVKVEGNKLVVTMTELQANVVCSVADEVATVFSRTPEQENEFLAEDTFIANTMYELRNAISAQIPFTPPIYDKE